jgi:multiple sugar transport system substrate-binding protein
MKKVFFLCIVASLVIASCAAPQPAATSAPVEESAAPVETTAPVATEEPTEPSLAGTEITVMLPPWAEIPAEEMQKFTDETGITVDLQVVGWDETHDKIAIAAAGNTAAADAIEVDWSWIGDFHSAGWFVPLNEYISDEMKSDIPLLKTFTAGGNILAVPYANDFRVGTYNKVQLEAAGITEPPATWDELVDDCVKVKEAGVVEYPLGFSLSPSEGTTTMFLLIGLSHYGPALNEDGSLNTENVLSTLQFIDDIVNVKKIVDPNNLVMIDREISENFYAGNQVFALADPGMLNRTNDPEKSQIVGQTARMLIPGREGVRSATFGLPEGVGIPVNSENKEAAWKFIEWFASPEAAQALWDSHGYLPVRNSVFSQYIDGGKVEEGDVLLEQVSYVDSFAPGGLPTWYPKFSLVVQDVVNKVASATMTPEEGVEVISTAVDSYLAE